MSENERKEESPRETGRTIGGHASHTGGCWMMIIITLIIIAFFVIRSCR